MRVGDDLEAEPIVGRGIAADLTRYAARACQTAGVVAWPEFYAALRSSRENAWKAAGVAEPTYTRWLGHSVQVSRSNYVAPLDSEFDLAVKAG